MTDQEKIKEAVSNFQWMAQTIHNAYHNGNTGWRDCTQGVCDSMEHILRQLGYDKEGSLLEEDCTQ